MIRSRLVGFLGLLLFVRSLHAVPSEQVSVDENKIRIDFGTASLKLPVTNATNESISTTLHLSFVDPHNRLRHSLSMPVVIGPGTTTFHANIRGLLEVPEVSRANYGWLRLRYLLPGDAAGTVSLSRIAPEPFILDVISPRNPVASTAYRIQVLARNPASGRPVPNVEIRGKLVSEEEPVVTLARSARTNALGFAELNFDLPRLPIDSDLELEVQGKLGKFVRKVSETLSIDDDFFTVTSMDKPIYQPGETLRVRTLVFDRWRNALKGSPVHVSILNSDDDTVFKTSLVTSAFGEAHTEWTIPENARAGNYEIRVGTEEKPRSIERVWIGRYDLPNFSVEVHQKRPYYVPGQSAEVEIRADYLFGKAVPFAAVRVVREMRRSWNYRESKWDIEEGEVIAGTADREGAFHVRLKLDDELKNLSERRVFMDVPYAAFVTDPSTGRTEQGRFWTRITLYPIHLYIAEPFDKSSLPLEFYVVATYADGTAAICDIEIFDVLDNDLLKRQVIRTNKYGVARVRGFRPSVQPGLHDDEHRLEFHALDAAGNTGRRMESFLLDENALRLYTDKALYASSEAISVHVESSFSSGQVVVNASTEGRVLYSTALNLASGKGDVVIPTSKAFSGTVLISAYHVNTDDSEFEGRRVSFPASAGGLEIESTFDKKTYAPGDEAILNLRLRNGSGSPQPGLFGVTVFDKAVEDRAKTDAEFGGRYSVCHRCGASFEYESRLPDLALADLDRIDRNKPVSPELELAAEVLLLRWLRYDEEPRTIRDFESVSSAFYSYDVQNRFNARAFSDRYPSGFSLPVDEPSLREMVLRLDPEFDTLRDPWDNPYRLASSVLHNSNQIEIISAGADEIFESPDDFRVATIQWPYFADYGRIVRRAVAQHHDRTGGYVRDLQTFKDAIARLGEDFDDWRDPHGRRYSVTFGIDRNRFTVDIRSEDWLIWREITDYTADLQPRIDTALNQFILKQGSPPQSNSELRSVLAAAGISDSDLSDPWSTPYYMISTTESGYFDSVRIVSGSKDGVKITPVTRQSQVLRLRSAGPDRIEGTPDDFTAFSFVRVVSEQSEEARAVFVESPFLDPSFGAIYGVVIDASGALIPGVSVQLTTPTGQERTLYTAEDGHFLVRNLDPGTYQVRLYLPGFQRKALTGVFVRAGDVTRLVATLEVAGTSTMVEVSVESSSLLATAASVGEVVTIAGSDSARPLSTPRLREYFPETLLWQPAVETGAGGIAQVRFKLADSMTTWKAVVIASTKDGRIAVSEKEIVAFQPFFVEHDPPKLLTDGDRIDLPVVVRSYLDRDQSVALLMKSEDWFASLNDASRKVSVKAGDFTREVFSFEALKPVQTGRQRMTAIGSEDSDAIEKTSTVFPFGREVTQISSGIFRGSSQHEITVSPAALAGSVRAELKIYPNLMSHVVDAIEGIMQRPHGCAEQVISSAYPSLLFLKYAKQSGHQSDPLAQKAKRYVEVALDMLRAYQSENGGFSYWTRGEPNAAVTAYALQFMMEAKSIVEIDEDLASQARQWLVSEQATDGSWQNSLALTAYIASVLSMPNVRDKYKDPVPGALAYLRKSPLQTSEPYVTASVALAALQSGEKEVVAAALDTLRSEVHYEREEAYWDLQTNTPFYSWGRPGRLEATAVVLRAFSAAGSDPELVDKGLLFLLRNKDRYGVWYSTQATVRVLDAFVSLLGSRQKEGPGSATIFVNGQAIRTVSFGTRQQPDNPVTIDLSTFFKPGPNLVEVVEHKRGATANLQLVESHYVPWDPSAPDLAAGSLRYAVRYSKQDAAIGDSIVVRVEAERTGFRGYGMLLAEIGLPPGADVDRASLAAALTSTGRDLSRYDVFPDRVIAYLWPRAGGTTFEFKFRPRYGLEAHTPPSKLYDYYNPEAYSIILPEQFRVR